MGQLELSEGREWMDLVKSVLHAEALGIALCWAIGCCPYVLIATAESTPSARTGNLAPLGADIIYHPRRHRSSLGMGSRLRVKMGHRVSFPRSAQVRKEKAWDRSTLPSRLLGGFKVATYFILIFYLTGFYCEIIISNLLNRNIWQL
jgi:hypothetical protein